MTEINKIDITKIDLEKDKDKIADLPGLLAYPHQVGSQVINLKIKVKSREGQWLL